MRKAQSQVKAIGKSKKDVKDNEREMHKMRKDLLEAREQIKQLTAKIQELKEGSANQRQAPSRVQSAYPSGQS